MGDSKIETGQTVEIDLEGHLTEENLTLDKTSREGISEMKTEESSGTIIDLIGVRVLLYNTVLVKHYFVFKYV